MNADASSDRSRVFVTGASGFLGRALLAHFDAAGWDVAGVDRVADPAFNVVAGDVVDPAGWTDHLAGADLVIHTAAVVSQVGDIGPYWKVNVLGTRRVVEAAISQDVGRFVHISSVAAYSFDFPAEVDETYPLRTNGNPYVDTKVASEQVVLQAHAAGGIECTVIRPTDIYGPRSRPWTIIPVQMLRARQFMLPAMGAGVFSPVYIDNVVEGISLAATLPAGSGQVFNIGDGITVTCNEYFGRYATMLGGARMLALPKPLAVGVAATVGAAIRLTGRESEASAGAMRMLSRKNGYSIEKARRVLGYEPAVSFEEGMRRTEEWLRSEQLI
jgi:nucleoside-diphosphate-sugar epimerase